jgi:hypothetical protein
MTLHRDHPDIHDHGLADECPRCAEHALAPQTSLDSRLLADLRARLAHGRPARSQNEAIALLRLRETARRGTP